MCNANLPARALRCSQRILDMSCVACLLNHADVGAMLIEVLLLLLCFQVAIASNVLEPNQSYSTGRLDVDMGFCCMGR